MITQSELKELLFYNSGTGIFYWVNPTSNRVYVGKPALNMKDTGYIIIRIHRKNYRAHRLAWLYMTGKFPKECIDHINGIKNDNRWCNLREATKQENAFNSGKCNNKWGFKGVYAYKNKYRAEAKISGKKHFLGTFNTPKEAGLAYKAFAKNNYGKFYKEQSYEI
jgi:hypothetical protein